MFYETLNVLYTCPVACTDFNLATSLDVAVDMFALVGGQDKFVEACGGRANIADENLFSRKNAKTLEVDK